MLVITRKQNEALVIGGVISVRIVSIQGDLIELAIEVPEEERLSKMTTERNKI